MTHRVFDEAAKSVVGDLIDPLRTPQGMGYVPSGLPAAISMRPGAVLATGRSRAWTLRTLLIVPFATLGAAFAGGTLGIGGAALASGLALLLLLGFNAILFATDGTFIVEARRLVFRMRAGIEQAWPFDPSLRPDIRWTGNRVFFTRSKTLYLESNADEMAELLQHLCDPTLHDAEVSNDTAYGKATLFEKDRRREGVVVLRPDGATFIDETEGTYLLAALVGSKPVAWRLSAFAVAELAHHVPAKPLGEALNALVGKGLATRWETFQFALGADEGHRGLELRREGDRLEATLEGDNPAIAASLGRAWRASFARLEG